MKKGILFSLSLLVWFLTFSQDYQCIRDDGEYYFTDGIDIKVISIDSVILNSTGDTTTYYNFPVLGKFDTAYCFTINWPSWIGRVEMNSNGDFYFYNIDGKFCLINALANEGEYWICYEYFTGFFIRAMVSEIQEMEFLGISDSVKKITFQLMDSMGNIYPHPINEMYLLLSKNYGFIRTVNFKVFPDLIDYTWGEQCHEFELSGISNPSTGKQNLTKEQIFNLDVGDEYHTKRYLNSWSETFNLQLMIYKIIDKEVSISNDTIHYYASRCGKEGILVNNVVKYYFYNDTIDFQYILNGYKFLDTIPEKVIVINYGDGREYSYNTQALLTNSEKMEKRTWYGFYSEYPHDCIMEIITEDKNPGIGETYYIEGIGGPFWDYELWYENYHHLLYFKKGEEEWGVPLNCDSLLTGFYENHEISGSITIAPNPMHNQSRLTINNSTKKEYQFQLFNSIGVLVRDYHFRTNDLIIQRENLNNGIYFYLLSDGQKVIHSGKLIIR